MDNASQPGEVAAEPEVDGDRPIPAIVRFFIAAVITYAVQRLAGTLAFTIFANHLLLADAAYRASAAAALIGIYALLLGWLDHREGDRLALQGLPLTPIAARQFLAGTVFGFVLVALSVATVALHGSYGARISITPHSLRLACEVLMLLLAGALLEEVMFRGYPFQRLLQAVGPVWAVVVLSAMFAAVHLGNPNAGGILSWAFLNTLAIGVLLAVAYLRTRTLWLPLGIHFSWNFTLGFLFGLPVSGMSDFAVVVHGTASGQSWLTGGAYGLENSLTVAILVLVSVPILILITSAGHNAQQATKN